MCSYLSKDPPTALLIDFDDYDDDGPCMVRDPETNRPLVPLFRVKRDWVRGAIPCVRTQFPLTIAYASHYHPQESRYKR